MFQSSSLCLLSYILASTLELVLIMAPADALQLSRPLLPRLREQSPWSRRHNLPTTRPLEEGLADLQIYHLFEICLVFDRMQVL